MTDIVMLKKVSKLLTALVLMLMAAVVSSELASAHVTVQPSEVTAGSFVEYTVRVPCERDNPTTKVRLEIPQGVVVSRFLPLEGWQRQVERDAAGRVVAVTWYGGTIAPDEYQDFSFLARNPTSPGKIAWRAFQTYQDGTLIEWVGPEGTDRPASVTTVKGSESPTPGTSAQEPQRTSPGGPAASASPVAPQAGTPPSSSGSESGRPEAQGDDLLILGTAVVSLLSLVVALTALARTFRPARRP